VVLRLHLSLYNGTRCCVPCARGAAVQIACRGGGAGAGARCTGVCFKNGEGARKDDAEKAMQSHRKAAEQGGADAQCNLGVCYGRGACVRKGAGKRPWSGTAHWKAAALGLLCGRAVCPQCVLRERGKHGEGVPRDMG
jgi:TPR repeat protein